MFSIRTLLPISASVSVPTKQSQSIPITLAGRTIEKAQEKEGLLVFLGMKSVNDYILIFLAKMFQEVQQGKKPYDLLFLNDATKQDFDKGKWSLHILEQIKAIYNQVIAMLLLLQL
ncbi:hypothetical protein OHD26_02145 [Escherichia coli]|nr:hypothetical protein [Escherichia coli]